MYICALVLSTVLIPISETENKAAGANVGVIAGSTVGGTFGVGVIGGVVILIVFLIIICIKKRGEDNSNGKRYNVVL